MKTCIFHDFRFYQKNVISGFNREIRKWLIFWEGHFNRISVLLNWQSRIFICIRLTWYELVFWLPKKWYNWKSTIKFNFHYNFHYIIGSTLITALIWSRFKMLKFCENINFSRFSILPEKWNQWFQQRNSKMADFLRGRFQ